MVHIILHHGTRCTRFQIIFILNIKLKCVVRPDWIDGVVTYHIASFIYLSAEWQSCCLATIQLFYASPKIVSVAKLSFYVSGYG